MQNDSSAKITDIIYFHGVTLPIITFNKVKYIPAKCLTDLAGIDWRTAKRSLLVEENVLLYAVKQFKSPVFAAQGGSPTTQEEVVHIQFDRAYLYLARINTRIMKARGNVNAAEKLLQLQIEWAKVLHDYETHGVAIKNKSQNNELMQMDQEWLLGIDSHYYNAETDEVMTVPVQFQMPKMPFNEFKFGSKLAVDRGHGLKTRWRGINQELNEILLTDVPVGFTRVRSDAKLSCFTGFTDYSCLKEFNFIKKIIREQGLEGIEKLNQVIAKYNTEQVA